MKADSDSNLAHYYGAICGGHHFRSRRSVVADSEIMCSNPTEVQIPRKVYGK